ncbi:LysR family transcriptional regulator [Phyllobacterium sp. SYP-B3895]|uniref:LysR family transcriptional regulator n=1 Tax=Phyllobacterium sp. SYP-B3895 TaxID=2663240 RepID=UPI001299CBAF|nr:LysR family transcriptional regulator [Phyllobacterium sp. SYP-B3895]MRG55002.1 LysR family transcriptional regulator [Phyllobacterium sp. SYP-B3895]
MRRVSSSDLAPFLVLARHRSFRRAADEIGCTTSALSHALKALEARLDLRLFNRTTRSVALTEAGERLLARVAPAFRDIDDALDDLNELRGAPIGRLRFNTAHVSAKMVLLPVVARFLEAHPKISVEIAVANDLIDMVSEGFDAGIRFGEVIAQDMIAVPIGPRQRTAIVASPAFFDRHAKPTTPEHLHSLPCVGLRFGSGRLYAWEFERGGVELSVEVNGPLIVDDQDIMIEAALLGVGVAYAFESQAIAHIEAERLVRVLEDWCPYYGGLYLYYPSRRQMPAALRAFVDFVKASGTALSA